jgi:hypothetical protein
LYENALVSNEPPLQEVVAVYAMISRIRMLCSRQSVECADKIMHSALDIFFAPNKPNKTSASCMRSCRPAARTSIGELVRAALRSLA